MLPARMQLPTESYLLLWVLLTTKHGRSDEIPELTQNVAIIQDSHEDSEPRNGVQLAPLYGTGSHRRLLSRYGHGLTGIPYDNGDLVTTHHGLGIQKGIMPLQSHGLGSIYGTGYHGGLLNGHHRFLSLHGARQASGGDVFIPPNNFIYYGHPERNQISGNVPVIHTISAGQRFGIPFVQANKFYKPGLGFNVTGIKSYPVTRPWNYPELGVHATGVKGFHGAGLGVYYGAGTPELYNTGVSRPHAGWTPTLHKLNNIHGTAGVSNYNSGVGLNGFQSIGVQGGEIGRHPVKGIPWYYGQTVDHRVMGASMMGAHKDMPTVYEISSPGYGNSMTGYHAGINKGYQGLANVHNPELHSLLHVDGTRVYHGGSEYHGHGYQRSVHNGGGFQDGGYNGGAYHGGGHNWGGYHRGGYSGGSYHGGGYNKGSYHGGGYNGGGYHRGGYNGGGYHRGGYNGGSYHGGGYNGNRGGYHGVGVNGDEYQGGLYHGNGYYRNRYHTGGYNIMDEHYGMNGFSESGHYKGGKTEHHGSFKSDGSLQWPMSNGKGNKSDDKREADQKSKYSIFKGERHSNQDKHDKIQNNEKDSSEHRNQMPNNNKKYYASEIVENGTDADYRLESNNETTLFPEGMDSGRKETENGSSVAPTYGAVQPKLLEQINITDDDYCNTCSGNIGINNKTNDVEEEMSMNYTKITSRKTEPNITTSINNDFMYETDMSVGSYPLTMSNRGLYATPYARGLLIDLLPKQTSALHAGSLVQLPAGTGVKGAQFEGTYLKRGGSVHYCSSKQQNQQNLKEPERTLGSVTDKLLGVGLGLGLEGYQSKDNVDGKLWTGYDSHMYDHHGVDFGYGSVPLLYQPWYYSYGQYYMTPYHRIHSEAV